MEGWRPPSFVFVLKHIAYYYSGLAEFRVRNIEKYIDVRTKYCQVLCSSCETVTRLKSAILGHRICAALLKGSELPCLLSILRPGPPTILTLSVGAFPPRLDIYCA